jgi:hypothetical protein
VKKRKKEGERISMAKGRTRVDSSATKMAVSHVNLIAFNSQIGNLNENSLLLMPKIVQTDF